jgi:Holliday junction resolvase RusA-like endonuclease
LTGKFTITLSFMMPVPKSMSKKKRVELIETKAAHIIKPDLDNLIKFILDCMNSIVLFDDSLVSDIKATKSYAGFAETLITVSVA